MFIFSPSNFNVMQKPLIPAFLLFTALMVFGCGKSTDSPENVDLWTVSLYNNKQVGTDLGDDTALFTGYTFEFNVDNQLVIRQPDGSTKDAKWGADAANQFFVISIENPTITQDYLVGNWEIELYSGTDIKLKRTLDSTDPNPSNATELEFKKQ